MHIDASKLSGIIQSLHAEIVREPHLTETGVAIGKIDGIQVQIRLTKDFDDHLPNRKAFRCLTT